MFIFILSYHLQMAGGCATMIAHRNIVTATMWLKVPDLLCFIYNLYNKYYVLQGGILSAHMLGGVLYWPKC